MATRKLTETPVTIPANVTVIEFRRSDGNSQWPTNTTCVVDSDGQVNYMRHLDLDAPTSVKWRLQVARAVAIGMGMPENQEYAFAGWPEGYRLFDHNKGPENNPRHDVYLFGSPRGRFRSINEFIPHAIWLMRDESMEHTSCHCKYCSKKAQKEITASMSSILRSSPMSLSPSPTRVKPIRERKPRQTISTKHRDRVRDTRTYAAVQKRPEVTKQAMLVERNSDLRAVFSKTEMKLKRWFREGELIWCALDRSIFGHEGISIELWPAFVGETRLKSQAKSRDGGSHVYASSTDNNVMGESVSQEAPWMVQQYYAYKVQLLVVNRTMIVADEKILPYQSHVPPPELIDALKAYPPEKLDFSRETLRHFDPCADYLVDFDRAIAPYAMALQIGAALSSFWSLTDEWNATFEIPQTRPPPAPRPSNLQDAIDIAHRHNAQNSNSETPSSTTPNSNGMRMPEPGIQVTQVRYQGLWWGGERIWEDDFIRLKVPRRCLAPKGAENVFPPSGPGKSAKEMWLQHGRDPSELGAGARGIFMRLDGLIVVDVTQPDGKAKKECRACGMLYELADQDWEDPNPEKRQQSGGSLSGNMPDMQGSAAHSAPITTNFDTSSIALGQAIAPSSGANSKRPIPAKARYPLPEAPQGYRFRPILPEGHEAVISLSLISGRYYPRILLHPLLDDTLKKALTRSLEESNSLWALEGLSAGFHNSVDPTHYRAARGLMVEEAERIAREQLEEYTARMDVD